jgi:signal transduction histidine kinase/DNA-binding LacI/PurR family transcriptional regulator
MDDEEMTKSKAAPVIGFLAARFDEAYQHAVWRGASREAERLGAGILFFGGQRIGSPIGYEAIDNIAFDLAAHGDLAGLVVMSNVIGTYISAEEQLDFLRRFDRTSVITIGIEFPDIPSVGVDASGAMSAIAEHLALRHGRCRFLFLAGPRGHREAEARLAEFRRALDRLSDEGRWRGELVGVSHADFVEDEARSAVARFLASGGRADAIVAANDLMAVGALAALAERGVEVPAEVSVTGFDDTEDSRFSVPPLTTVRQPAAELGRLAVRRLAAQLGLIPAEPGSQPRVSFVVRESCGCCRAPEDGPEDESEDASGGAERAGEPARFDTLAELSAEVNREIREIRNPARLRRSTFEPGLRADALLTIADGERRFLASQRFAAERRASVLGEIEASLVSSFALEDILGQIAQGTRDLGISGCWLCLFESRGAAPEWSKLLLASDAKGTRILAPYGLRFRTAELVPGGLPAAWSAYVCEPLRFGEDRLGYLVCTADSTDRRMYDALRDQVSSALKGALLMAAERDRERSLERNVRIRTLELSAANDRLLMEIARRRDLERELLDVSNRIMSRIGQDIHDNLCQDMAGLGIMATVLERKLRRSGLNAEAEEAAALAAGAGETAVRARDIARGLYPAELEAHGLVSAIERLVLSSRERAETELRFEVTPGFTVRDSERALHIYRIVQEALTNALRHARAKEIKVGLYMDRESLTVEVSDDGVGLPPLGREGNGMGLHILKYRASVVGGELRIRTRETGTSVTCRIPR